MVYSKWCTVNGESNLLAAFQFVAPERVETGVTTIPTREANDILLGERDVPTSTAVSDALIDKIAKPEQEAFAFVIDMITLNCFLIDPPGSGGLQRISRYVKENTGEGRLWRVHGAGIP